MQDNGKKQCRRCSLTYATASKIDVGLRIFFTARCYVFFFSSRRRHTMSLCDWSSDVCSSDLYMFFGKDSGLRAKEPPKNMLVAMGLARSEERRVGKERGSRWSRCHYTKNS